MPSFSTDTPAETLVGWAGYEEYGEPVETPEARTVSVPVECGWLGAKERATSDATAHLQRDRDSVDEVGGITEAQ